MDTKEQVHTYVVNDDVPMEDMDPTGVLVKPKWRGTSQDKTDMQTLGRNQVLRVRTQSCCPRPRQSRN